jgi:FKBP-type peptidyl-prolyl cis-trans isomerase FklB
MNSIPVAVAATLTLLLGAAGATAADVDVKSLDKDGKLHYALGYQLGRDLAGIETRPDALVKGLADGRSGAKPGLSQEEMQAALNDLGEVMAAQRNKAQAAAAQDALTENEAFLSENAKRPGVKTTASGMQYKVIEAGSGSSPTLNDEVTVHYRGHLIDGTEFDSSYNRGEPATFKVGGVIAGWTEALQLMKPGAKYQLFIPPNLAYGDRGRLANQLLIFDVELLSVQPVAGDR